MQPSQEGVRMHQTIIIRRNWLVNTFFLQGLLTAVTPNFLISGCGFSKVKHVVQTKNIYHFLLAVLAINRLQSVTLEWWPLCIWTVHLITEKPLNVDKEPPTIAAWRCCAHSLLPLEWFSILGKLQLQLQKEPKDQKIDPDLSIQRHFHCNNCLQVKMWLAIL